jgi:mono/diheme cytochrome c family protein
MRFVSGLIPGLLVAGGVGAQPITHDQVAPVFSARCVMCHSGPAAPRGLRLDSYDGILKGGTNGTIARPGDPAGSELLRRIKGDSQPRMPMTGPPWLTDAETNLISGWISAGMPRGSGSTTAPAAPARPKPGEAVTYAHVAPIFARRCAKCHTENGLMGPAPEGYRLTSYEATLSPADRLRVVPGQPLASELVRRIRAWARPPMPFDGPPFLDEADIRLIEDWVAQGARDAQGRPAPLPAGARLRLHGRLDADGRLDGLPLAIGPATRVDKRPRSGDYVEVRGWLEADGRVGVERLRRR